MPLPPTSQQPTSKPLDLNPHELELKRKQELLSKVKTVRERLARNQGMVEGMNPAKVYVWVHQSDNRQIHFQAMGYELCRDPAIKSSWKQADGSHKRGDVILYQCDRDLHEAIQMEAEIRAVEAIEGAKEGFKAVAMREGFPIYEPGKK